MLNHLKSSSWLHVMEGDFTHQYRTDYRQVGFSVGSSVDDLSGFAGSSHACICSSRVASGFLAGQGLKRTCSGLMNPDTNLGGNIAAVSEVFNEKTTSIFLDRI